MTQWHLDWQSRFPPDMREAVIGRHRADIQLADGYVIEFQHSSLSVDEIQERESHYGRMAWVFDASDARESERLDLRRKPGRGERYRSFRWKQPRRSVLHCRQPVFLDVGDGWLLRLQFMGHRAPYGGCGQLLNTDEFIAHTSTFTADIKEVS
jgi:hypothetical protein